VELCAGRQVDFLTRAPGVRQSRIVGLSSDVSATNPDDVAVSKKKGAPAAFDLKGTMASFTVLRLRSTDVALIERQLRVKIAQLPQLFSDAPVLFDVGALAEGEAAALPFAELARAIRSCKLVPVGAANVPEELRSLVVEAGLAILQAPAPARPRTAADEAATTEAVAAAARAPIAATHAGPMVVTQPVRSGQVVYAQNNDLVVLAAVNAGAQVIADGHVHIYAPLRGRAVAGAQGLPGARIFCQKLEAELVAIGGAYVMAEEIPSTLRGRAAQVHLENGDCRISALG
jgi:septum site-determining protein MinC